MLKLGRKPPDYSIPRLWVEDYTVPQYWPTYQQYIDRCTQVPTWPMYENDIYGCCTIAMMGHGYGAETVYASKHEVLFDNSEITTTYERVCPGFNPIGDQNDNGAMMSTVFQDQYANGMTDVAGTTHNVAAYAQIKSIGPKVLSNCLRVFGSVYLGVNLPQSAEDQFSSGRWTYVKGSPIAGGHAVTLQYCGTEWYPYKLITWGSVVNTDWTWLNTYVEEAWVTVSEDYVRANGTTMNGLNLSEMLLDMNYVKGI